MAPHCSTELQDKLPSDMESLAESFSRLQQSLQQAQAYVDDVVVSCLRLCAAVWQDLGPSAAWHKPHKPRDVPNRDPPLSPAAQAGKRKGSTAIGRYLAETVAAVPLFSRDDFERMLADQQNDCTLVLFLSKLIQAHLALADKLGTMQLPLL